MRKRPACRVAATSTGPGARRRGAAALEFALCLPVLTALVSGVADWGWFLVREAELVEVVRDAARAGVAAEGTTPAAAAEARLEQSLAFIGITPTDATITCATEIDPDLAEEVLVVRVTAPYAPLVGLLPMPATLGSELTVLVPA